MHDVLGAKLIGHSLLSGITCDRTALTFSPDVSQLNTIGKSDEVHEHLIRLQFLRLLKCFNLPAFPSPHMTFSQ